MYVHTFACVRERMCTHARVRQHACVYVDVHTFRCVGSDVHFVDRVCAQTSPQEPRRMRRLPHKTFWIIHNTERGCIVLPQGPVAVLHLYIARIYSCVGVCVCARARTCLRVFTRMRVRRHAQLNHLCRMLAGERSCCPLMWDPHVLYLLFRGRLQLICASRDITTNWCACTRAECSQRSGWPPDRSERRGRGGIKSFPLCHNNRSKSTQERSGTCRLGLRRQIRNARCRRHPAATQRVHYSRPTLTRVMCSAITG